MDGISFYVVGIEIGTNFGCGFASNLGQHKNHFPDISFITCSSDRSIQHAVKMPTAIVLNHKKDVLRLGFEAEQMFTDLYIDDDVDDASIDNFYFKDIIIQLKSMEFDKKMQLTDFAGKRMDAITVLSFIIRFVKDKATKTIEIYFSRKVNVDDDVTFVLTVPSIWGDGETEDFMILAAEKAGINKRKLTVITEAMAAVSFCNTITMEAMAAVSFCNTITMKNTTFIIIDIGGENAAFTVYERRRDGSLHEAIPQTFGPWGSKSIDEAFHTFLDEICGPDIISQLKTNEYEDYIELLGKLERIKRSIMSAMSGSICIQLPLSLLDLIEGKYGTVENAVQKSSHKNDITCEGRGYKLRISTDVFRSLFKSTVDGVINHTKQLLANDKLSSLNTVFVIGGMSKCDLLQNAMKEVVCSPKQLVFHENSEFAVLMGAICFGVNPEKPNISRLTNSHYNVFEAQASTTKCISCDCTALFFCYECKSALCQNCRKTHDKLPATRNHSVADLQQVDISSLKIISKCSAHKSEFLYFCTKCKDLICSVCVTTTHKGHELSEIKLRVEKIKETAVKQVSEMKANLKKLSTLTDKKKAFQLPKLNDDAKAVMSDINSTIEKVKKTVEWKRKLKINEIENQKELEKEDLKYEVIEKERLYRKQLTVCFSLERLLEETNDVAFYTSYQALSRDMFELDDVIQDSRQHGIPDFSLESLIQEVLTDVVADFDMSLVPKDDGSFVVKKNSDIRTMKKGKRERKATTRVPPSS